MNIGKSPYLKTVNRGQDRLISEYGEIVEVIDKSDTKFFKPLLKNVDGELEKRAIAVCEKRRIFKDVYENWYISNGGDYKNRLIIPIYNSKNKIAYWQGRALFDNLDSYFFVLVINLIMSNLPKNVKE